MSVSTTYQNDEERIAAERSAALLRVVEFAGVHGAKITRIDDNAIEIQITDIITSPLMRLLLELRDLYPEGGCYIVRRARYMYVRVYYKAREE